MRKLECADEPNFRLRIINALGASVLLVLPSMAEADDLSPTVRLEACGLPARGYLEQTSEGLELTTLKHVVDLFAGKVSDGCEELKVGTETLPLSNFVQNLVCDDPIPLTSGGVEVANDSFCRYSLGGAEERSLIRIASPIEVSVPNINYGDYLGTRLVEGDELVVFEVRRRHPSWLRLEPVEGEICDGASGSPLFPVTRNASGAYQVQDNRNVGAISNFYATHGADPKVQCLKNNSADNLGVLAVLDAS